jgi:hypothetical protein
MQVNAIARDQVRPEPDALEVAAEYQLQLVARHDLEGLELDARAAGIEAVVAPSIAPARASTHFLSGRVIIPASYRQAALTS